MHIKKMFVLSLLMFHVGLQSYDLTNEDIKNIAIGGITAMALVITTYLWATSGDSVQQRIEDAYADLATMPEYDQPFDTSPLLGEQETQIKQILKQLNIELDGITKNYNQKLLDDLVTIKKTCNNLWFKSLYGGTEIADVTRKVYEIKITIESLIQYLQTHHHYMHGYQIIQESSSLLNRNIIDNSDEIIKIAQNYDPASTFPLYNYIQKIQKDLACIASLTSEKNNTIRYPELSSIITEYESILVTIKTIITTTETYKSQTISKLEYDIAQLLEKYQKLELTIKKLELDIAILKMR